MSTNNVLSPANGAPIIVPSQDMILGLYYTTMMREGMKGEGMSFTSIDEVEHALAAGEVHLHAKITARLKQIDEDGNEKLIGYTEHHSKTQAQSKALDGRIVTRQADHNDLIRIGREGIEVDYLHADFDHGQDSLPGVGGDE